MIKDNAKHKLIEHHRYYYVKYKRHGINLIATQMKSDPYHTLEEAENRLEYLFHHYLDIYDYSIMYIDHKEYEISCNLTNPIK